MTIIGTRRIIIIAVGIIVRTIDNRIIRDCALCRDRISLIIRVALVLIMCCAIRMRGIVTFNIRQHMAICRIIHSCTRMIVCSYDVLLVYDIRFARTIILSGRIRIIMRIRIPIRNRTTMIIV